MCQNVLICEKRLIFTISLYFLPIKLLSYFAELIFLRLGDPDRFENPIGT